MTPLYRIEISPKAKRDLRKIPNTDFEKIDRAIMALEQNPRPFGVKKLQDKVHRVRMGNWRIIYAIDDSEKWISIVGVKRRSEKTYRTF